MLGENKGNICMSSPMSHKMKSTVQCSAGKTFSPGLHADVTLTCHKIAQEQLEEFYKELETLFTKSS